MQGHNGSPCLLSLQRDGACKNASGDMGSYSFSQMRNQMAWAWQHGEKQDRNDDLPSQPTALIMLGQVQALQPVAAAEVSLSI